MLIDVLDGGRLLEKLACPPVMLSDGRPAALWRGAAYPLLPSGDAIDVAWESHAPPFGALAPQPDARERWLIVSGVESAYVLLRGSELDARRVAERLRAAGHDVGRIGRHLCDVVDDVAADWFVRVNALAPGRDLTSDVEAAFGSSGRADGDPHVLRAKLLQEELERTRARMRRSETDAARRVEPLVEEAKSLRDALAEERRRREEAEANAQGLMEARAEPSPSPASLAPVQALGRVKQTKAEIADVLDALLPRIRLLRDGIDAMALEFANRRALYRTLAELQRCDTSTPAQWKTVQGVTGWIERSKISNGVDNQGRVYARLDRSDRSWQVLVAHKSTQERDIAWLGHR
jgi:hypothetical protein